MRGLRQLGHPWQKLESYSLTLSREPVPQEKTLHCLHEQGIQPDRGGAALWHLGPLAEGAVAVFVGLALLVVAVRWIGTRS